MDCNFCTTSNLVLVAMAGFAFGGIYTIVMNIWGSLRGKYNGQRDTDRSSMSGEQRLFLTVKSYNSAGSNKICKIFLSPLLSDPDEKEIQIHL